MRTKPPVKKVQMPTTPPAGRTIMKDTDLMPFGEYKDRAMANVPAQYLLWLWDSGKVYGAVKNYISDNLDVLRGEQLKQKSRSSMDQASFLINDHNPYIPRIKNKYE